MLIVPSFASALAAAAVPLWLLVAAIGGAVVTLQDPEVRTFEAARGVRVVGDQGPVGVLEDLVVQVPSGRISAGVIAVGQGADKLIVAVPYGDLQWDDKSDQLRLGITAKALGDLEAFDSVAVEQLKAVVKKGEKPASAAPLSGTTTVSRLASWTLQLRGVAADKVRGAAVELTTGTVVFLIVSDTAGHAGDRRLHPVPWAACAVIGVRPEPHDELEPAVTLSVAHRRLAGALSMTEVQLNDPLYRARVYRFFGVTKPEFEAQH